MRDANNTVGGGAGDVDLMISDIQHNQSRGGNGNGMNDQLLDGTDLDQLLKTGAFTKEMMMGQTMRDLGNTIKEANGQIQSHNQSQFDEDQHYEDDFNQSQQ